MLLKTCLWAVIPLKTTKKAKLKEETFFEKLENVWIPEKYCKKCEDGLEVWQDVTIAQVCYRSQNKLAMLTP